MRCLGRSRTNLYKTRCNNNCKLLLCHHHKPQWWAVVVFFVILIWSIFKVIGTVAGINADLPPLIDSVQNLFGLNKQIICDRDINSGCTIDLKRENDNSIFMLDIISSGSIGKRLFVPGRAMFPSDVVLFLDDFPFIPLDSLSSGPNSFSPYRINITDSNLLFFGQLKDYKTNELLGWFDENEFELVKPCGFSWNKDERGIEIIDKYGQVCFSFDYDPKNFSLKYKGFFKIEDVFHVYSDTAYNQTKNLKEAEKFIRQIQPNFDHYGQNSDGKRLESL